MDEEDQSARFPPRIGIVRAQEAAEQRPENPNGGKTSGYEGRLLLGIL